ncbi:MAG: DUF29 family protein [Caldilineaceae bacterium]|nr:DUF29 family protein [Caldilineaceae bacterium]HRJ41790.1 DUF29 domain-containing protein [Caldilineaceae bacterium]
MQTALTELYEEDFHLWLTANVEVIRWGELREIDAEHIAEELEAMSKRERRELISRLTVLLAHLLKWEFQPTHRSRSWRNTLTVQRGELADLLEDSPSLRAELENYIDRAYGRARLLAEDETGLEADAFPAECPYALEAILDPAFLP